ncbi:hypothetical protein Tco_0333274 [Tanacetum coccineum]
MESLRDHQGIGDCLELKLEAVIDCFNEIFQQNDIQAQDNTNVHVGSSLPLSLPSLGKALSEAQLTFRKAIQLWHYAARGRRTYVQLSTKRF